MKIYLHIDFPERRLSFEMHSVNEAQAVQQAFLLNRDSQTFDTTNGDACVYMGTTIAVSYETISE